MQAENQAALPVTTPDRIPMRTTDPGQAQVPLYVFRHISAPSLQLLAPEEPGLVFTH